MLRFSYPQVSIRLALLLLLFNVLLDTLFSKVVFITRMRFPSLLSAGVSTAPAHEALHTLSFPLTLLAVFLISAIRSSSSCLVSEIKHDTNKG